MGEVKELTRFFNAIREDPRIGTSHISLYMAFFQIYNLNGLKNPVNFSRKRVMELAKISGFATFHKCLTDLSGLGCIEYFPSFNPSIPSKVNLLNA
jgi:replication initiation and membrane attachment protein DnaB